MLVGKLGIRSEFGDSGFWNDVRDGVQLVHGVFGLDVPVMLLLFLQQQLFCAQETAGAPRNTAAVQKGKRR
jgi:hypothetical protein